MTENLECCVTHWAADHNAHCYEAGMRAARVEAVLLRKALNALALEWEAGSDLGEPIPEGEVLAHCAEVLRRVALDDGAKDRLRELVESGMTYSEAVAAEDEERRRVLRSEVTA